MNRPRLCLSLVLLKISIDKGGGNRKGLLSVAPDTCLIEEDKVRLRGEEVMLHRLEINFETTNVAEDNIEKVGGGIWTPLVVAMRLVRPADISSPLTRWGLQDWLRGHIHI